MAARIVVLETYTIHGKSAVIHRGFAYMFDKPLATDNKRWKSINYKSCKAYIWINENSVVKVGGNHTHEVEPEIMEARKRVKSYKEDVISQRHGNLDNLAASARDCETAVQDAMPSTSSLKRLGRRQRVKVCCLH
jgi:hypothetical protein